MGTGMDMLVTSPKRGSARLVAGGGTQVPPPDFSRFSPTSQW
jgi:hypothetical protein